MDRFCSRFGIGNRYRTTLALLVIAALLVPHTALAEITSTVTGNTLTVVSDADDAIVLICQEGTVAVNGEPLPDGAASCAEIATLIVQGGPGPNQIDGRGLLTATFPALTRIALSGGAGDDVITGTVRADTLDGGPGRDRLIGGRDQDRVLGGADDDTLVWNNGDGSDILEGGAGYDTIEVNGAANRGDLFEVAPNGARVAFTRTLPGPFTLDIGDAERLYLGRGQISDTIKVNVLPNMVVEVASARALPPVAAAPQPMLIVGAGEITNTVEAYQLLLGGSNNGGEPGPFPNGVRTINWDGVPDEQAAPNAYDPNFFNAPDAPRARGAVLSTPGEALIVSANAQNPTNTLPRFGHINPSYVDQFKTFSAERLFSPVGSNIADITFFVPGSSAFCEQTPCSGQPAVTRGFGAVYTDIDTAHTAFEYFDIHGNSLGKYQAPIANEGLSFLGVIFDQPIIHRVRVAYGTSALGPDETAGTSAVIDVAVMDDFIYGEPQSAASLLAVTTSDEPFAAKFQTPESQNEDAARLSGLSINFALQPSAPAGQSYAVWLVDDADVHQLAGTTSGAEPFTYVDAGGQNLVGATAAVAISLEDTSALGNLLLPRTLAWYGEIPAAIRDDLRQLVVAAPDTPQNKPYDPGAKEQANLALTHAQLARDALAVGDLTGGRAHGEHVWNILYGAEDALYGDVNEDGETQNPGDGYGVVVYARQSANTADRIAETPGLDDYRRSAAIGIAVCARNLAGPFANGVNDGVLGLLNAVDAESATVQAELLIDALDRLINGVDADSNGAVDAHQGECGAEQAYQLSHHLFDIQLEAAE